MSTAFSLPALKGKAFLFQSADDFPGSNGGQAGRHNVTVILDVPTS